MMTRREALKTTALASVAYAAASSVRLAGAQPAPAVPGTRTAIPEVFPQHTPPATNAPAAPSGPFTLPPLPYAYDALEPFIDTQTMQIHHDKHHAAYVTNLNKAVAQFPELLARTVEQMRLQNKPAAPHPELVGETVEELLKDLKSVPEQVRTAVRNQGGGHFNHSLFWLMMKKDGGGEPAGGLAGAINKSFGSFAKFKDQFATAAVGLFGSGWTWLVSDHGDLKIESTSNQDSPLSDGRQPLLGVDVWEHAYYLKYQNRRIEYVAAWFKVINWDFVSRRFQGAVA